MKTVITAIITAIILGLSGLASKNSKAKKASKNLAASEILDSVPKSYPPTVIPPVRKPA